MIAWWMLGMQATDAAAGPPALPPVQVIRPCHTQADGDDVVVCAPDDREQFRLKPLPDRFQRSDDTLPKAEVPLTGKLKAAAETEQVGVGGFPSNRIMLRLKLPF